MYVPELIPEECRVLTNYFKSYANKPSTTSGKIWQAVNMILAVIFLLAALLTGLSQAKNFEF